MTHRPSLAPAVALTRSAVRAALGPFRGGTVVVGLSGGADSLALVAAVAFEAVALGIDASVVVVDHGLQDASADVAEEALRQARAQGLEGEVRRVEVADRDGGPEAAARAARYAALADAAMSRGAGGVLVAHTLDDQAETVLLGLARGSGAGSLQGMAPASPLAEGIVLLRPFLGIRRGDTVAACDALGLRPWHDPHNDDPHYSRVRVRHRVLPVLEAELGPGVAAALARTAEQAREDADAFEEMIEETIEDIVEPAEGGISVSVPALAANPAALRNRIIRHIVAAEFHQSLTRAQTIEVARLATDWSGQGPIDLPGCFARRVAGRIEFVARP